MEKDRNNIIRGLRASGKTLQSIGKEFNLSRERVRQLTEGVNVPKRSVKVYIKKIKPVPEGFKKCSQCKEVKSRSNFHKDSGKKDGLAYRCADCAKENTRKFNYLKLGVSIEEYNKMFESQGGRCSICGRHRDELNQELSIDHNHMTGKVRELLCVKCNSLLGYSCDSIDILRKAIDYLERLEKD